MDGLLSYTFLIGLGRATVRTAIPILLAALGEIVAERSGLLNIGIEGQMLLGALASFLAAYFSGSLWLGLACGALAGMLLSLVSAYLCITRQIDQIIVGITLNMFGLGFTSYWYRVIFGITTVPPSISAIPQTSIPILSKMPIIGPIFFQQDVMVYAALGLTIITYIMLFKTTLGLNLRATGEHPRAAETLGVNVLKIRYVGMLTGGAFAGLGGAYLSLVLLGRFVDNITSGRGFIALAIVIFGRWHPVFAFVTALLFGAVDALQLRLQAVGLRVPYQIMLMLPYLMTVITMAFTSKRVFGPAALGQPYGKEKS